MQLKVFKGDLSIQTEPAMSFNIHLIFIHIFQGDDVIYQLPSGTTIVHKAGNVIMQAYPNGTQDTKFANGTVRRVWPDG